MLKITPDPKFSADVQITIPGQEKPESLPLTFRYMNRLQYVELLSSFEEEKDKKGKVIKEGKTQIEAFPEFVLGWGLEEEFVKENIELFLNNYPAAYREIFSAYSRLLIESRVKN